MSDNTEKQEQEQTPQDAPPIDGGGKPLISFQRLVVQLLDTPHNREAVGRLLTVASDILGPVDGPHAVIKREEVLIYDVYLSPTPDDQAI